MKYNKRLQFNYPSKLSKKKIHNVITISCNWCNDTLRYYRTIIINTNYRPRILTDK